jgi:hypothetical protein
MPVLMVQLSDKLYTDLKAIADRVGQSSEEAAASAVQRMVTTLSATTPGGAFWQALASHGDNRHARPGHWLDFALDAAVKVGLDRRRADEWAMAPRNGQPIVAISKHRPEEPSVLDEMVEDGVLLAADVLTFDRALLKDNKSISRAATAVLTGHL